MMLPRRSLAALVAVSLSLGLPATADAFPGFFAGKDKQARLNHSTHVVHLTKGEKTVVTIMPDYEGPLNTLVVVLPVPADVELGRLKTMKANVMGNLDQMTAPRFHEFWETDPCDKAEVKQEWERDLKVKGTGFLGKGKVPQGMGPAKKAKELTVETELQYRVDAEYVYRLVSADKILGLLQKEGYVLPAGTDAAVKPYIDAGMKFIVAEVNTKKVELSGGDRAQLSPIQYWTKTAVTKVPSTLGLVNAGKLQELFMYVLHPKSRYEAKNYETLVPPNNLKIKEKDSQPVKEKAGDFYAGFHDALRAKKPKSMLAEYAWSSEGCGEPCPPKGYNEPLSLAELLTLGGDALEQDLPEETRNPEPPEREEEAKKKFEKLDKAKQAAEEEGRRTIVRIKGLVERQKYVVTRLHHRYDKAGLPQDPELQPTTSARSGVDIPKGPNGEIFHGVAKADRSKLQTRFLIYHPWIGQTKCEDPVRWRWGKAPRTYRGVKKIYIAQDTVVRRPKKFSLSEWIQTPVPLLGLAGSAGPAADAKAGEGKKEEGGCGCNVPGQGGLSYSGLGLSLLGLGFLGFRRRQRG